MNKVILIGTVNYPPRYNETSYGSVMNVVIKTTHRYKNNTGEIVEKSQQTRAALWGKLAELHRGVQQHDLISLEGRLQNKKVQDKSGAEVWQTEVVCNSFEVLVGEEEDDVMSRERPEQTPPKQTPPTEETVTDEYTDDDIPF